MSFIYWTRYNTQVSSELLVGFSHAPEKGGEPKHVEGVFVNYAFRRMLMVGHPNTRQAYSWKGKDLVDLGRIRYVQDVERN